MKQLHPGCLGDCQGPCSSLDLGVCETCRTSGAGHLQWTQRVRPCILTRCLGSMRALLRLRNAALESLGLLQLCILEVYCFILRSFLPSRGHSCELQRLIKYKLVACLSFLRSLLPSRGNSCKLQRPIKYKSIHGEMLFKT